VILRLLFTILLAFLFLGRKESLKTNAGLCGGGWEVGERLFVLCNRFLDSLAFWIQNNPLFLQTYDPKQADDLNFYYMVHTALDVIEEKSRSFFVFCSY